MALDVRDHDRPQLYEVFVRGWAPEKSLAWPCFCLQSHSLRSTVYGTSRDCHSSTKRRRHMPVPLQLALAASSGVVLGAFALIACELPFLLTAIGLSGIGVGMMTFHPPLIVEYAGLAIAALGAALILVAAARRWRQKGWGSR